VEKIMEYTNTEHEIGLDVTSKYIECVNGFPFDKKGSQSGYHNHFVITITSKSGSEQFDYYGSSHDCEKGKKNLDDDDLKGALQCIVGDALYGDMRFEEFCDELGYDEDSCTSYRIHKACQKTSGKLQNVITNNSDEWYTIINDLNEE
jgi:hypothetical protein